jgi:hypothetical protein
MNFRNQTISIYQPVMDVGLNRKSDGKKPISDKVQKNSCRLVSFYMICLRLKTILPTAVL